MKIQYFCFPNHFWSSAVFQTETNPSAYNFGSPKSMVFDFSTFPDVSPHQTKMMQYGEITYNYMKQVESQANRPHPSQRVGATHFEKGTGFLFEGGQIVENPPDFFNAHTPSQQIRFATESGLIDNDNLHLNPTAEAIQWINGEIVGDGANRHGIGYFIDPSLAPRVKKMIDEVKTHPVAANSKYGIYSLQAFSIWDKFYEIGHPTLTTREDELCAMLNSPPDSIQALCGFDFLMEDFYDINSDPNMIYVAMSIFFKQLARKKYELTGVSAYSKIYDILWSHTESVEGNGLGLSHTYRTMDDGTPVKHGEGGGLTKPPADPTFLYNFYLKNALFGDGFLHFKDILPAEGTVNIDGQNKNLEKIWESQSLGDYVQVSLRGQVYSVEFPATWTGNTMFAPLAVWQAKDVRAIIDEPTTKVFTPDFIYNGVTRTGNFKQIPYNLRFGEPTIEVKFNAAKTQALIFAANLTNKVEGLKKVVVKLNANGVDYQVPIMLKGCKAEGILVNL